MRAAGTKWLPQEERESDSHYDNRLSRSFLFDRLGAAVDDLGGRPFSEPVKLEGSDTLQEPLDRIEESVDDERRDLHSFCKHLMEVGLKRGLVHILVDYPPVTAENLAEERQLGLKPLLLAIDPKSVIGWRHYVAPNGEKTLTQLRILERVYEDDGDYGVAELEQVRVIEEREDGTFGWSIWQQTEDGDGWMPVTEGDWSLPKISLVTIYFDKTVFMTGRSPLERLPWLNLAHWQNFSDHNNNLRFSGTGTIFAKGLTKEEMDRPIVVGINQAFRTQSPNADMKIVEHSGNAVKAAEANLEKVERRMDAVARGPLVVHEPGDQTATSKSINEGKGQCELQSWVRRLASGVRSAYGYAGEWVDREIPDDLSVQIYDDFGMLLASDGDKGHIHKMRQNGDLCQRSYIDLFKLYGVLPERFDVDAELEAIEAEGPDLGMVGRDAEEEGGPAPAPGQIQVT
jgi:hypothetical protein